MSADDPTRLDPPIPFELHVDLVDPRRRYGEPVSPVLLRLCALHGHPGGVPLAELSPPALVAATYAVTRGASVRLLLTHLDAEGRPTFALAPPPAPPLTREELEAKAAKERAAERVRQIGRFLFSEERIPLEVDTVEGGVVTFKPEPGNDGQRFTLVECALEEGGPFTPAPAEPR